MKDSEVSYRKQQVEKSSYIGHVIVNRSIPAVDPSAWESALLKGIFDMKDVYSRTMELLGIPDTDEKFGKFTSYLGAAPREYISPTTRDYDFASSGISLLHEVIFDRFILIIFHINTVRNNQAGFAPYTGDLPHGITTIDTREEVIRKFGDTANRTSLTSSPTDRAPGSHCDDYTFDTYRLRFNFNSESGILASVSALYDISHLEPNFAAVKGFRR